MSPSGTMPKRCSLLDTRARLCHEAYTIWLFTRSDLKTIVIPKSIFGVFGALAGSKLVTDANGSVQAIIIRAPLVVFWVWIVLLPFNIDNQRRAEAIEEDRMNRPWRPLPSKRLSPEQAFRTMLVGHVAGIAYCLVVGPCTKSYWVSFLVICTTRLVGVTGHASGRMPSTPWVM
ncbi:hypothetical protein BDV96DRAFT_661773 [Lophiotrema nucula]|uniref:UbiA prenyltransferase family-domain-containing protein n=1 Tax=Lophiotrema nucula TaxID=690887 RepID=A0A6A5Z5H8_9PLEO|nr:hypothetical protein BDV96DRAFT_661773 [Lophiotrema nucula]